jgi:hypothetical protein
MAGSYFKGKHLSPLGMDMPIKTKREINYFLGEHMGMSFFFEHCVWPVYRQWWGNWSWSELMYEVVQVLSSDVCGDS